MNTAVARKMFNSFHGGYAIAAATAATAALLEWVILPLVGGHAPFLFFILGLVFAVIFLGRGPALLVLLVGVVDSALRAPPIGSLEIYSSQDLAAVLIFAASGVLLVGYGTRLRFTTMRAALAEQRLALAQENTGVGIFELDFEARTAFVSQSLCQMLGRNVTPGEIDLAVWLGGLRVDHVEESQRVMQEQIARGEFRYEREQRVVRPDGEIRWLLNRVELQTNATGMLRVARGVAVDITERKRTDELLEAAVVERERARAAAANNERRFSVALESSVVPFTILTPVRGDNGPIVDFVWTYVNPAAARALGREVADLIGRGIGSVLPRAWDSPGLFARYVSVLESGEQCEFEIQSSATRQGVRWYNVLAAPLQG
jgi:PAS domain S-box-containing protein